MSRYIKRLLMAFLMSAGCFAGTRFWYVQNSGNKKVIQEKESIAILIDFDNIVKRKPIARSIWETISKDDDLYAGESIKTSSDSEARIKFKNSDTVIELEPDSLIVLEESKGSINLNFLKGNIFLKSKSNSNSAKSITVKAGKNKLKLDQANVSLSQTKKGNVDLEVFSGKVNLTQKSGKVLSLDKSKSGNLSKKGFRKTRERIKILYPTPNDLVYFDAYKKEKIRFKFRPLPKGYTVYFAKGKRRKKLKKFTNISSFGESGFLTVSPKVGKNYWQLIAVSSDKSKPDLKSKVFRINMIAKVPPTLITPKQNESVVLTLESPKLRIKWANKSDLSDLSLEIARDRKLKKRVLLTSLSSKVTSELVSIKEKGRYYWRIVGYMDIKGKKTPMSSPVQKFNIGLKQELIPPRLSSPLNGIRFSFKKVQKNGVLLTWKTVPGIKKYQVRAKHFGIKNSNETAKIFKSDQPSFKMSGLKAGNYQWSVASVNSSGKVSNYSKSYNFQVKELPRIDWASGNAPSDYYYYTARPTLRVDWSSSSKIVKYRLKFIYGDLSFEDVSWLKVKTPFFKTRVKFDGEYQMQVEGISAKNKIVARSSIKKITVSPKPLLPAPRYPSSVPPILKANRSGNIRLKWLPVSGAKNYKVQLIGDKGKVISDLKTTSTSTSFKRMRPGVYKVSIRTYDSHNRLGPEGDGKKLSVPKTSNIKAPTLKGIKVK